MEKPFNCSECYLALATCYIYSGVLSCIDYACRTWTPPICGYFEKGKTICFVLTVVCETPLMLCIATKVLLLLFCFQKVLLEKVELWFFNVLLSISFKKFPKIPSLAQNRQFNGFGSRQVGGLG